MITIFSTQPSRGHGAEAVLSELLHAWPGDGEPLTLASPPGSSVLESAEQAGHSIVLLPTTNDTFFGNWRDAGAVASELAGTRRVHAWAARGFEGARHLAARLRVPSSGTLHDHPSAGFHGRIRRRIMKSAAAGFTGLVCVSDAVRSACRDGGYRCPLAVVRNGLADCQGPAERPYQGTPRVGFLGMYAAWKGFDVIQEWIRSTGDLSVEWRLYGEVGAALAAPAAALAGASGDRVQIRGQCPTKKIFAEIDVLVHASSAFDPLPTVLLEAARAGIPSVACDLGGAAEIVVDGETGFLFSPVKPELGLKKLRELITDSTLRARQATAARQRFRSAFDVARMVREYESFWSEGLTEHHAAK